jgi:integrase
VSYFLYKKPNSAKIWARIKVPGRKSFSRSTRSTVTRTAEQVAQRYEREALVQGAPVTLEEALTVWHGVQVDKGASPHTLEITLRCGGHLIGFFGRHRDIRTLGLDDTQSYLRHRREFVADATIYREVRTLRSALHALKRRGRYDGDPNALWPVGLAQTFPGRKRWVPPTEWKKLHIALAPHFRDHLVVYTWTGLRLSELFRLVPEFFDIENRRVFGDGTKTKTGKAKRWIPMHPEVETVLRRRLKASNGGPLFELDPASSVEGLQYGAGFGDDVRQARYQRTRHRFYQALRRAAKKAGIVHVSPNDLRRTFCSWCKQAGIDKDDVADWLGHNSSQMVREVYGHDSAENAVSKVDKLPSILVSPTVSPDAASKRGSSNS